MQYYYKMITFSGFNQNLKCDFLELLNFIYFYRLILVCPLIYHRYISYIFVQYCAIIVKL